MEKNQGLELEVFRCNIAGVWTAEEMANFILNVRDIYNLSFVVNSIHGELSGSLDLLKLSNYIYPEEELRLHRFEYASPGFVEVIGEFLPLISFAMIIHAITLVIKFMEMRTNRDRLKWEKEKARQKEERDKLEKRIAECKDRLSSIEKQLHQLPNNSEIIQKCKKLGMPELEIRELKSWLAQRVNNLKEMVSDGKIISANIMQTNNMVRVSAGKFLYGKHNEEINIEEDYLIDVFPVTNKQYETFISEDEYDKDDYWSIEGTAWKRKNNITKPAYWNDYQHNQAEQPVVGVSYYEAEAYAKWAGKRLPTEQEWERAARGTDGRKYPWGNEFDIEKCNAGEGIGKNTPVGQYPNGISPEGCYDMSGNVWEWTSSLYEKDAKKATSANRVIRGGGWYGLARLCRAAVRDYFGPGIRLNVIGFRLARSVALGP